MPAARITGSAAALATDRRVLTSGASVSGFTDDYARAPAADCRSADDEGRLQDPRVRQDPADVLHVPRLLVVGDLQAQRVAPSPSPLVGIRTDRLRTCPALDAVDRTTSEAGSTRRRRRRP